MTRRGSLWVMPYRGGLLPGPGLAVPFAVPGVLTTGEGMQADLPVFGAGGDSATIEQ